jgi:hypothetical protein
MGSTLDSWIELQLELAMLKIKIKKDEKAAMRKKA